MFRIHARNNVTQRETHTWNQWKGRHGKQHGRAGLWYIMSIGSFLAVKTPPSKVDDAGLIPAWGTKFPHTMTFSFSLKIQQNPETLQRKICKVQDTVWRFILKRKGNQQRPMVRRLRCWNKHVCVCVCLVAQLCLTLCTPMDCSPPGSFVHGVSPGKNIGMGCHALLQGIFPTQRGNPGLPHYGQILCTL